MLAIQLGALVTDYYNWMQRLMHYVIFDTETNGIDPTTADVLSLGWLKVYIDNDYTICKHVERYVLNDDIRNEPIPLSINGITDEYRHANGVPIDQILDEFRSDISECTLYAYSRDFDIGFLKKYDPTIFDDAISVEELRVNERESVLNCIQRIIAEINHDQFTIRPRNCHYHTAYDDCYCELIILFHDILKLDCIPRLFESCDAYVPCVGSGQYKNKPLDMIHDKQWLDWFLNVKISPYEDYLRRYAKTYLTQ